MSNPYVGRPAYTQWRDGVARVATAGVDPVVQSAFKLSRYDAIATAGSCFAQHISRTLTKLGYRYLVTERFNDAPGTKDENFGVFPARFGNIYTARQFRQLLERAYGKRVCEEHWTGRSGCVIDPFRPRIQKGGFASVDLLSEDRKRHFVAVRSMVESCNTFVFTLGLTEAWVSDTPDEWAYPLAPGVVTDDQVKSKFHNFSVSEVVADMLASIDQIRSVNPAVKVILTVSPVALVATYEDRHVLVSTVASKSILRAAADEITQKRRNVAYFPSYEIVTGPQTGARFFAPDLREVTDEGVAYVMSLFSRHYLEESGKAPEPPGLSAEDQDRMAEIAAIICDEEAILQ